LYSIGIVGFSKRNYTLYLNYTKYLNVWKSKPGALSKKTSNWRPNNNIQTTISETIALYLNGMSQLGYITLLSDLIRK
jgi:hypothetical protein